MVDLLCNELVLKEVQANNNVDWAKIKEILNGVLSALDAVVALLPDGVIKNFVKLAIATLHIVVAQMPGVPA